MESLITAARYELVMVINALAKECYDAKQKREETVSFACTERALEILKHLVKEVDFNQLHHYVNQGSQLNTEFIDFVEFIQHYEALKQPCEIRFIVRHAETAHKSIALRVTAVYHETKKSWWSVKKKKEHQKTFYLNQPFQLLYQFFIAYHNKTLPNQLIMHKQLYGQEACMKEVVYWAQKVCDGVLGGDWK